MIIKNNVSYIEIFPELAIFLVLKSTLDVIYVDVDSTNVKLTSENVDEYCEKYKISIKDMKSVGSFFMVQKLPDVKIYSDKDGYNINSLNEDYNWLKIKSLK